MDEKRATQYFAGVLLIGAGALLMVQQVVHWPSLELSRLWPIIVIGMGANGVVQGLARRDGKAGWGVSMILIGTVLLLHFEHVMSLRQSWPLFIVAQGVGLLLGGAWCARHRRASLGDAAAELGAAARHVTEVRDDQ